MKKINVSLRHDQKEYKIEIGRKGEHDVTQVIFDVSDFVRLFGGGHCELVHSVPYSEESYPIITEMDGTNCIWTISASDTVKNGVGRATLRYYTENGLAKSCGIKTIIHGCADSFDGVAPDPVQEWVDQAAEFLGKLKALNIVQDVSFDGDMLNIALYDGSVKQINFKAVLEAYNFAKQGTSYTKEESDEKYLTEHQKLDGYAKETYVNEKVSALVNQAPETLDTLKELSDALGNDPNFATTIAKQIGEKANKDEVPTNAKQIKFKDSSNVSDELELILLKQERIDEDIAYRQKRDIYLEYGKPIEEQGFESVEDIIGLAMTGVTVNVVDFRANEFAIMSRVDIEDLKLVFCNDKHLYTISFYGGNWGKEEAGKESCRVESISGAELTDGTAFETIGCPEYISADKLADHSDYALTEEGWYVFTRIHGREGDYIGDDVSLITGVAGIKPPNYGDTYVDIAIKFDVASESQKVTIQWNDRVETFVFKSTDLAIRNLDYRVTFYLYNIDDYCTWEYQLATDATFVAGKGYYKLQNGQYVKQTVTTGASVPANTYYVHKSLTIQGFTRNMSYTLDTTVDCPVTIHLPEVGGNNYGAWFEVQMNFLAAYSVTVVPSPGQKVSANGVNTPKVGINIVNILYHKPTNTWLPTLTNWKVSES